MSHRDNIKLQFCCPKPDVSRSEVLVGNASSEILQEEVLARIATSIIQTDAPDVTVLFCFFFTLLSGKLRIGGAERGEDGSELSP